MNNVNSNVDSKPLTIKERPKKKFTETVITIFVIFFVFCVIFGICFLWPALESINIKKDIAESHQISYNNVWELQRRIKFYQFDSVNSGNFNEIYCEIDGKPYSIDDNLSKRIHSYVDSWCY